MGAGGVGGQAGGKGGAAGGAGTGGVAGAGGGGGAGALSAISCHTNADCPFGQCFIEAPITNCVTAPAGRCTAGGNMGNCAIAVYHGYCGCLRDLDANVCAAFAGYQCNGLVGSTFPKDGSWSDYGSPTSCFGCFPVAPSAARAPVMSVFPGAGTTSF